MKILVCEDDPIVAKVIQVALESLNVHAYWVKDGDKAFRLLKAPNDYDMIITDIHMPHYNGDQILSLVREEQKKDIPIIMISSDDAQEAIDLARKSGVNDYMVKPVNPEKLKEKVKKLLKIG
jgi:DNA-binding response OmpR family regulator